jgi:parallel beta-helix repeat protein
MRKLLGPFLAAALAATTLFALSAGQALADHVQCGDVITQDTTLDSDLIDCPGDGLVIGADNITLDLNGHTVDGVTNTTVDFCGVGIANGEQPVPGCPAVQGGHDGVTIMDGIVREFGLGVLLDDASLGVVRGLTVTAAGYFTAGIYVQDGSAQNLVTGNVVSGTYNGIGLIDSGPDNRVQGNSLFGNKRGEAARGIIVHGSADDNRIERNALSGNDIGIGLSDSFGNTLIARNLVSDNCVGIDLLESQNTRIERNRVSGSAASCGLVDAGNGIVTDDRNNVVEQNVANQNVDDGIHAYGSGTTIARNTANQNGDLGIEAGPEVIDGGGNRAFGNGNPLQCLNVVCKTK